MSVLADGSKRPAGFFDACGKKSEKCSKKIDAGRENAKNI